MIRKNNLFKTLSILIFFTISTLSNVSAIELKKKLPKIGGSSGSGVSLDDAKTNFTKIFFESALDYMEAQFHLFNALEMNDEANKTRKSIDFVKDSKKRGQRRLTNAFNTVSIIQQQLKVPYKRSS